jgi:transcriptional regulator with XRE-family HTH domain
MADPLSKYIGEHLQSIRIKRNMTQAEVASRAGTKTNYYSKLERGLVSPSLKLLQRLIQVLDTRFKDLLP